MNLTESIVIALEGKVVKGYHLDKPRATFTIHSNGIIVPDNIDDDRELRVLLKPIIKKSLNMFREHVQTVNEFRNA